MTQFDRFKRTFGILLSTLSLVMLVWQGFKVGWVAPLGNALEWYQALIQFVFWWPEQWFRALLNDWNAWTGWHLHLYPQWKHVLILMWFYFFSFTKAQAAEYGLSKQERHSRMIPYTLWSAAMSLLTGVASGLVPTGDFSAGWKSDVSLAFVVGAGLLLFWEVWPPAHVPWLERLARRNRCSPPSRLRVALLVVGVPSLFTIGIECFFSKPIRLLPSPSLTFLLIFIFFLAVNWLVAGVLYSLFHGPYGITVRSWPHGRPRFDPHSLGDAWRYFLHNGLTRAGVTMMSAIFAAAIVIVFNIGLKYAGL